jgi:hypothetical protein
MSTIGRSLVFAATLLLMLSVLGVPFCAFAATEEEARSAIASAEQNVVACYQAVTEAEKAGANTTGLLITLNEAGALLSKAHLAFMTGDFDSANSLALQSEGKLDGFVDKANALKENGLQQGHRDFLVNVVGSVVGAVAVVFGGFVVWTFLKKRYAKTGVVA